MAETGERYTEARRALLVEEEDRYVENLDRSLTEAEEASEDER